MWKSRIEFTNDEQLCKVRIEYNDTPMRVADVIHEWTHNSEFRQFYISLIAGLPFKALFWEMPAVSLETLNNPYEFVAVNSVELVNVKADPAAFSQYFDSVSANETIVTFDNLGKDAVLVVPCPIAQSHVYPHLAEFVRHAPDNQRLDYFRMLGETTAKRITDRPLWVSTSGLGIYWLHARLDTRPKYYTYAPYR